MPRDGCSRTLAVTLSPSFTPRLGAVVSGTRFVAAISATGFRASGSFLLVLGAGLAASFAREELAPFVAEDGPGTFSGTFGGRCNGAVAPASSTLRAGFGATDAKGKGTAGPLCAFGCLGTVGAAFGSACERGHTMRYVTLCCDRRSGENLITK